VQAFTGLHRLSCSTAPLFHRELLDERTSPRPPNHLLPENAPVALWSASVILNVRRRHLCHA